MERRDLVIDIKEDWPESSNSISEERAKKKKERRCIYRVPNFIRNNKDELYSPHVISLGPFHHGKPELKHMEKLKGKVLDFFLKKIDKTLEDVKVVMSEKTEELMDAYGDDLEEPWLTDKGSFVELMVVDGCFLLLFFQDYIWKVNDVRLLEAFEETILPVKFSLWRDAHLLENQLPMRALKVLSDLGGNKFPLILEYSDDEVDDNGGPKTFHCLHSVWLSAYNWEDFLFWPRLVRKVNPPTVTELVGAGVHIMKADTKIISFEKGVLKLLCIPFDDITESVMLNLMAFEKMHNLDPDYFSYLEFLDCLINTARDVEILRRQGVIEGALGSDAEVAALFNRICKGVYPPTRRKRTKGKDIAKLLDVYCKKWYNKWLASFKRLYLSHPWAFFGLLGALFLVALTVVQTVYIVLGYYPH